MSRTVLVALLVFTALGMGALAVWQHVRDRGTPASRGLATAAATSALVAAVLLATSES